MKKEIVEEMLRHAIKHFNDDENCCTNQATTGHEIMFRGTTVKKWSVDNDHGANFHNQSKNLTSVSCSFRQSARKEDGFDCAAQKCE